LNQPGKMLLSLTMLIVLTPCLTAGRAFSEGPPRQTPDISSSPAYCNAEHNIGNIVISVSNDGSFGNGWSLGGSIDCFTGRQVKSCEFPKRSQSTYLWAGDLWVGAIVGRDTLVSTCGMGGHEFHPDESPFGDMIYRSNIDPARPEYEGAISEQDYIAVYSDTCLNCRGVGNDELDGRGHRPLHVEVTQRSFAWSYSYAEDFILMDYSIKNIGNERLRQVYMGIYIDADVHSLANNADGYEDDLSGFRRKVPALYLQPPCPPDSDVVNLAWTVDNDGGMALPNVFPPTPHAAATRVVRTPSDSLIVSYNWWVRQPEDYGPQGRATYRDLVLTRGEPLGDRNKYHFLSNGEHDFDQHRLASIDQLDSIWLPPPQEIAGRYAVGIDVRYLLSFGPFDVDPGQSLPISLAYICGENFHTDGDNFFNLPNSPDTWYEGVNFDSLGVNATWAEWVYDNPGVDSDSDGYSGTYTICNLGDDSSWICDTVLDTTADPDTTYITCRWEYDLADTVWRKGDGVPDFRGATPPPAPSTYSSVDGVKALRVEPSIGSIRVIWNGVRSETTRDIFSREYDFEGYRVWFARDDRPSSFSVVASYDKEDFNRWEFSEVSGTFSLKDRPFSLEELRCMYADSCNDENWHPDQYTRVRPLIIPGGPGEDDEIFYFVPQDFNRSILANDPVNATTPIMKVYPNAPKPDVLDVDSLRVLFPNGQDTLYVTDEGFIKYYEYEFTIENLLPTVPYWVNVTAFDYGSPKSGLEALETPRSLLPEVTYPLHGPSPTDRVTDDIFVWPNPYRLDGNYRDRGFEDFGIDGLPDDLVRSIHFANLPERCTIRIYSIDGDLIREFQHPARIEMDGRCPITRHEACWDLITRNRQQVVSGLYYWTVEDDYGNVKVGKLVVIM